ncbi:MAG: YqeG family HAD IIIA-type phosphatase [Firmicutes bacterium]|nr:YqeG family HAD IIIA-type phosphatase [Bacillota bacterium]
MQLLVPNEVLASVRDIDIEALKLQNIKGLLIDLDNTLVDWDKSEIEPRLAQWVAEVLRQGMAVCLVSNAVPKRVKVFSDQLGVPAVSRALKPLPRAFRLGLKKLGLQPHEAAVVGDQIFTDVLGGNRLGLYTILINPLSTRELRSTSFMRRLEKRMLKRMAQRGLLTETALKIRGRRGQ